MITKLKILNHLQVSSFLKVPIYSSFNGILNNDVFYRGNIILVDRELYYNDGTQWVQLLSSSTIGANQFLTDDGSTVVPNGLGQVQTQGILGLRTYGDVNALKVFDNRYFTINVNTPTNALPGTPADILGLDKEYSTIQDAVNAADTNGNTSPVFLIQPGIYNENITIPLGMQASFIGVSNDAKYSNTTVIQGGITINDNCIVYIKNIDIQKTGTAIVLSANRSTVELENTVLHLENVNDVLFDEMSSVLIQNCIIRSFNTGINTFHIINQPSNVYFPYSIQNCLFENTGCQMENIQIEINKNIFRDCSFNLSQSNCKLDDNMFEIENIDIFISSSNIDTISFTNNSFEYSYSINNPIDPIIFQLDQHETIIIRNNTFRVDYTIDNSISTSPIFIQSTTGDNLLMDGNCVFITTNILSDTAISNFRGIVSQTNCNRIHNNNIFYKTNFSGINQEDNDNSLFFDIQNSLSGTRFEIKNNNFHFENNDRTLLAQDIETLTIGNNEFVYVYDYITTLNTLTDYYFRFNNTTSTHIDNNTIHLSSSTNRDIQTVFYFYNIESISPNFEKDIVVKDNIIDGKDITNDTNIESIYILDAIPNENTNNQMKDLTLDGDVYFLNTNPIREGFIRQRDTLNTPPKPPCDIYLNNEILYLTANSRIFDNTTLPFTILDTDAKNNLYLLNTQLNMEEVTDLNAMNEMITSFCTDIKLGNSFVKGTLSFGGISLKAENSRFESEICNINILRGAQNTGPAGDGTFIQIFGSTLTSRQSENITLRNFNNGSFIPFISFEFFNSIFRKQDNDFSTFPDPAANVALCNLNSPPTSQIDFREGDFRIKVCRIISCDFFNSSGRNESVVLNGPNVIIWNRNSPTTFVNDTYIFIRNCNFLTGSNSNLIIRTNFSPDIYDPTSNQYLIQQRQILNCNFNQYWVQNNTDYLPALEINGGYIDPSPTPVNPNFPAGQGSGNKSAYYIVSSCVFDIGFPYYFFVPSNTGNPIAIANDKSGNVSIPTVLVISQCTIQANSANTAQIPNTFTIDLDINNVGGTLLANSAIYVSSGNDIVMTRIGSSADTKPALTLGLNTL